MKKRLLLGGVLLVILSTLMFGGPRTGMAQVQLLIDSPDFPNIPGRQGDCMLTSFQRQVDCTNRLYDAARAYNNAPQTCPSTYECFLPCVLGDDEPCQRCVNDCTTRLYVSYYTAERNLNTEQCGVCSAQLDTCSAARAAAQQCGSDYQNCGGLEGEGCWEIYSACRLASGIDRCQ